MITHSKTPRINEMCKDKWNYINGNYKKIFDYHKGIGRNTSYWDLTMEKQNILHFSKHFNEDCYIAIDVLQGGKNINAPIHLKDM